MPLWMETPLLFLTGIGVAALNAVAGGGGFFSFPMLVFFGVPPIMANATGKFAIWLGAASSIIGYLPEIQKTRDKLLRVTVLASIGSIAGSLLLMITDPVLFRALVPWLMLTATVMFAGGPAMLRTLIERFQRKTQPTGRLARFLQNVGMLMIGTYGGFFGAGMGIMLVAFCQLVGIRNVHEANAIKVVVATGITTLSTLIFIASGMIAWPQAIALGAGTLVGGYFGASYARRLPQRVIRGFIILYGCAITTYFFAT